MQKRFGESKSFWIAGAWTFEMKGNVLHEIRDVLCAELIAKAKFLSVKNDDLDKKTI